MLLVLYTTLQLIEPSCFAYLCQVYHLTLKGSLTNLNMKVLVNVSVSLVPANQIRLKHFKGFFFQFCLDFVSEDNLVKQWGILRFRNIK